MGIDVLKITISVAIAVLGWVVGHWLNSKRDRKLKRRELEVSYLVEVYRNLDQFIAGLVGGQLDKKIAENMNSAISDIQLFGTANQIELAIKITNVLAIEKSVPTPELNELVQALRSDLRRELGLEEIKTKVAYLNMNYENQNDT